MKKTKSSLIALFAALVIPHVSIAAIIQFEGIAPAGGEIRWDVGGISTYTEAGFDITTDSTSQAFFVSGTSATSRLSGASGDVLFYQNSATLFTIVKSGGGVFGLSSLDAGGIFSGSGNVQVTGYLSGGGIVQTNLTLGNVLANAGVLPTFSFDGSWNNLTAIDLLRTGGNFVGFDNITTTVAVIEPGTIGLLGLGFFVMALARRQQKF